jgi:hypothetical protein
MTMPADRSAAIACPAKRGSATDADDVVQDTWLRRQGTDRSQVRDATGFLVVTTTRLAITVCQSARARVRRRLVVLEVRAVDRRGHGHSQNTPALPAAAGWACSTVVPRPDRVRPGWRAPRRLVAVVRRAGHCRRSRVLAGGGSELDADAASTRGQLSRARPPGPGVGAWEDSGSGPRLACQEMRPRVGNLVRAEDLRVDQAAQGITRTGLRGAPADRPTREHTRA